MDFWDAKDELSLKPEFGDQRLILSSKSSVVSANRPDTSLSMIEERSRLINLNEALVQKYNENGIRYVFAKEITYDILISIYDVNSLTAIIMRPCALLQSDEIAMLKSHIAKFGKHNFEVRAIGLQNKNVDLLRILDDMHSVFKFSLIELDLFGADKRNVVIDLKTGMGYDVLMLNRIYRAGENANALTADQFKQNSSKFKFV